MVNDLDEKMFCCVGYAHDDMIIVVGVFDGIIEQVLQ